MNPSNELHDSDLPFGVYVAIRLHKEDKEKVLQFCEKELNIDMLNRASPYESRMHATVLYAQDPKNKTPEDVKSNLAQKEFIAVPDKWEIFLSQNTGKRCLVLKLKCPEIQEFHEKLKQQTGLNHSFPKYDPHISIHYDYNGALPDKLPPLTIRLQEMYVKPLYYKKPVLTENSETKLSKIDAIAKIQQIRAQALELEDSNKIQTKQKLK